jgi:hypothetical protein
MALSRVKINEINLNKIMAMRDYIVSGPIRIGKRTYYSCKCPHCNSMTNVRCDNLDRIKSCHSCHHKTTRPTQPDDNHHWCNKCKEWKLKNQFNFRKDGTSRFCKKCEDAYRGSNLNRINEYAKAYKKQNIENSLLYAARSRARQFGIQIDIDIEDIVIPSHCPVLGIEISTSGNKNNSPSLDKIIPELGYTKGNVRVISWRANWIKNNATAEEIEKLYKDSLGWKKTMR